MAPVLASRSAVLSRAASAQVIDFSITRQKNEADAVNRQPLHCDDYTAAQAAADDSAMIQSMQATQEQNDEAQAEVNAGLAAAQQTEINAGM